MSRRSSRSERSRTSFLPRTVRELRLGRPCLRQFHHAWLARADRMRKDGCPLHRFSTTTAATAVTIPGKRTVTEHRTRGIMGHHLSCRASWLLFLFLSFAHAGPLAAQDRMCDPGGEDCRAILIGHIRTEAVAIDVSFWFMEDARYTAELIKKWNAGIPVRVLIDPRANAEYPLNTDRLRELQTAGIPMRRWLGSSILHWKMMLFHGQNIVQFSGANYSADAWRPGSAIPYENYVDEAIYFTSDTGVVDSFRTKFDDQWIDPAGWADYANITTPPARSYSIFPKDPSLNFPPWENFRTRSVTAFNAERRQIDAIMYRITDRAYTDDIVAAAARG